MAFDIHIEPSPAPKGLRVMTFGDYPTVMGVQGVQKMVDRFAKCLLTPKGSDVSDLDYGTVLASVLGSTVDFSLVYQYAVTAVNEAVAKIQEYDTVSDLAPTERLADAKIESIEVSAANRSVTLRVKLTSIQGSQVVFLMPEVFQTR